MRAFSLYFRSVLVLTLVYFADCRKTARAVLYGANSMNSFGTLTFTQENDTAPVVISGTLTGLNVSSAHVCFNYKH